MQTRPRIQLDSSRRRAEAGFTLLELITVVTILSIVAGGAIYAYGGLRERSEIETTGRLLDDVRSAILRFREDVGYLPGEGRAAAQGNGIGEIVITAPRGTSWLELDANLSLLLDNGFATTPPYFASSSSLGSYDLRARRGWNGPYLKRARLAAVREATPAEVSENPSGWVRLDEFDDSDPDIVPGLLDAWSTPILLRDDAPGPGLDPAPRLVSAGPDRSFALDDDNIVVFLLQ